MRRGLGRVVLVAGLLAAREASAQWAPQIPPEQVPLIVQAAAEAGIDPAQLAATAARESNFVPEAYRAEPSLRWVLWRDWPGGGETWVQDGSIGPTQVLRSTMKGWGVDNEAEAWDLATNYRVSARIIAHNLARCGGLWAAANAYNTGSCRGYAAGNYANHIVSYAQFYGQVLASAAAECVATEDHIRQWYADYLGREAEEGAMWGRVGNTCAVVEGVIRDSEEASLRRGES